VLVSLFLARTQLLSIAVSVLATETPIPSATLPPTLTHTPAPTDTEIPTAAATEEPTATTVPMPPAAVMALSQGAPALEEGFGDNANNWVGFVQSSEVIIQEKQLQLRSSETGTPALALCQGDKCGPYQDFYYYQADMVEDRPTTLAMGLIFAINAQKSTYYTFAIRPASAEFSLRKFNAGQSTALIDWTSNPAIKFYPFVNKLGVSYQDGNLSLFVNGAQVGSYTDKQPFKSGRVGFSVESDGLRMLASNVSVLSLAPVTPAPPQPTAAGASGQPATQPAAYQSPTPASRFTPTITPQGACPSYVPKGNFVLIVFKTSTGRGDIKINGTNTKINQGNNVFYLPLDKTHSVVIGNKSFELYYEVCKIRSLKMN
jgi:hypothetical protein